MTSLYLEALCQLAIARELAEFGEALLDAVSFVMNVLAISLVFAVALAGDDLLPPMLVGSIHD